jgi:hypothetical protein
MKVQVLPEPGLQFGAGGVHVDIRAGLEKHGAFDRGASNVPVPIGVGLVGATATIDKVRDWIESCRNGVLSREERLRELRPAFPGMRDEIFGTQLAMSDATTRTISRHELQVALSGPNPMERVVDVFMDHARDLAGRGHINVLLIAPPLEVFALGDARPVPVDAALDEAQDAAAPKYVPNFHDTFKAKALELAAAPSQILRPDTYGGGSTRTLGTRRPTLQDPATRAWNFHSALYYKAGGVPWRLVKHSSALSTCYVGASFFKSIEGDRLATSVAQVFNERGEGLILQGGNATIDRRDLTPHLSAEDAHKLLANGLASYRREHRNMPARVLVHKTSYFNNAEIEGCREAAKAEHVELLDLVSVRRAGTRLLRAAVPAVVRGTTLIFDDRGGIVYLKGTVPYFRTYPGMYVPRALEFTRDDGETAPIELAKELLDLSKLNFNNTQFDSGDPITVRAARRVGDILKHVSADRMVQSRFRFFT